MKLYLDKEHSAPSPRRVRIFVAEKGIQIPTEEVTLHKETRSPEFLLKNPMGSVPVLELDDGTCIAESVAICNYLEELHPEPSLFGSTPEWRAIINMWVRRVEIYLYIPIDLMSMYDGKIAQAKEGSRRFATRTLGLIDAALREREFIASDSFTMADIFALSALDFGSKHCGFDLSDDHTNVIRWHKAVSARASAKA